jgi:peptidoglycan hydrolase CwlO-like protein
MTEKRFRPVSCVTEWYIEDKKTSSFAVLTPHQASDLLNKLHEENKKLKQVNEMDSAITERNLIEENEQLKSEIEELENKIEVLEGKLWNCQNVR